MARRTPRHVVIEGQPMVALTPKDFENLTAMRRQLGGQGVRMRSLREALLETAAYLEALDEALRARGCAGSGGASGGGAGEGGERDRPAVESLLASLPEQIRRVRSTAGSAKPRTTP